MKNKNDWPEITEKSEEELEEIIRVIQASNLSDAIKVLIVKCIELAIWFPQQLQRKTISLSRLRTLIFGKGYGNPIKRKTTDGETDSSSNEGANKTSDETEQQSDESDQEAEKKSELSTSKEEASGETKPKKKGHGRMPHDIYNNAQDVTIDIEYNKGDPCPSKCGGRLGKYKPGTLIRIRGQSIANVTRYTINKLRCNLCGFIVEPVLPPEVGNEKYDPSFKATLAYQKYYLGMPFYRQEVAQKILGFPLPDSTQWDLIEQLASVCYVIFNSLKKCAANGNLIHNDDTKQRILEVIRRIKAGLGGDRTGMFTTGIIANFEGHQISLFLNGTKHAGENLADILEKRSAGKGAIIQMCDALSHNVPKNHLTILCNCLSHSFRKYMEIVDFFPEECTKIMKSFSQIYENDEQTRTMTAGQRLSHHQKHSSSIMEELKKYVGSLLDDRLVEPNSELGKAIIYMQRHWVELTRFLSVAGAPLDNNVVERSLKIAIRNRKSSMFYKTEYSAYIGGMITSLIYTCVLSDENPIDYLTMLQRHATHVTKFPSQWLPWNYQETLDALESASTVKKDDANPQGLSLPEAFPVAA